MLSSSNIVTPHTGFLPANTVFAIDASQYDGSSQTVPNYITTPADGSAQTTFDFSLGGTTAVSTDDPTWVAKTGVNAPAKWTLNGSQFLHALHATSSFTQNLIRSDQSTQFWVATAYMFGGSGALASGYIPTGNSTAKNGFRFLTSSTGSKLRFQRYGDSTNATVDLHSGLVGSVPYLHIFTWDNATGNYLSALNSKKFTVSGNSTGVPSTAALASSSAFGFGTAANSSGASILPNGSELYGMSCGNGTLTNTDLLNIVNYYNNIHGRTYA